MFIFILGVAAWKILTKVSRTVQKILRDNFKKDNDSHVSEERNQNECANRFFVVELRKLPTKNLYLTILNLQWEQS